MSDDVERLAKWLNETQARTMQEAARELLARGVTLPTPPRATPLEAAAREIKPWLKDGLTAEPVARDALTAAVGALSDEAAKGIGEAYRRAESDAEGIKAMLAALTRAPGGQDAR